MSTPTRLAPALPAVSQATPRRGALQMLGAALLGLAAACQDIRRISRTG